MNKVKSRETRDPRKVPCYSVSEAAQILRLSYSTLYSWLRPVVFSTDEDYDYRALITRSNESPKLSFFNLIEGHVIKGLTEQGHKVSDIRSALEYAERKMGIENLLTSEELLTGTGKLVTQKLGSTINLSVGGQLEISCFLDGFLDRVDYEQSRAIKFFPVVGRSDSKSIVVQPTVKFGKPVLVNKGISTHIIAKRANDGETIEQISSYYGLTEAEVGEAIQFERAA